MKKSKVVSIVLNNFTNDSRVLKEAKSLLSFGIDVRVVAIHESGLKEHETVDSVPVTRLKLISKNWGKTKFTQVIKYIEFFLKVIKVYRTADIFHCHDLPTLPIGCLVKLCSLGRVKLVYDSHEYAVNDLPNESIFRQRVKRLIEGFFIHHADKIITVSDGIAELYQREYKLSQKPYLILNCPPKSVVAKSNKLKSVLGIGDETFVILYQGALSEGRGIRRLINAFIKSNIPDCVLVFMGYGQLEDYVKEMSCNSVFYHPAVPPSILLEYTVSANCGISLIEDSCISYRYCLPNKIFEYFMAGLPVIVSNLPEMKKVINDFQVGEVLDLEMLHTLSLSIQRIRSMPEEVLKQNLQKVTEKYNWSSQELVLKEVYDTL